MRPAALLVALSLPCATVVAPPLWSADAVAPPHRAERSERAAAVDPGSRLSAQQSADREAEIRRIERARREADARRRRGRHPVAPVTRPVAFATALDSAPDSTGSITGTVRRSSDLAALAGVGIDVYDEWEYYAAGTTTLADGSYSVSGLPAGRYYVITSNALGYADELYDDLACANTYCWLSSGSGVDVTAGGTQSGIDFDLDPSGALSGTVTADAGGTALVSVSVEIYDQLGRYVGWDTTDAGGAYAVAGLKGGTYYLRTWNAQGYIDEVYDDIPCPGSNCDITYGTGVTLGVGATVGGRDFGLAVGGRVSGTVTSAGVPLDSIDVDFYDSSGRYVGWGYTNGAGEYLSGSGLPTGTYYARTYNRVGYLDELYDDIPCLGWCSVTSGDPIAVTVGTTTPGVDFDLAGAGQITGRVTDQVTGAPLPQLSINLYDASGSGVGYAYTDGSGHYRSSGLPAGAYYARTSNSFGYIDELYNGIACPWACTVTSGTPIAVTSGGTATGIDFALNRGGRISGRLTDATTGDPLPDVRIWLYDSAGSYFGSAYGGGSGEYITAGGLPAGTYHARTDNTLGYIDELYDDYSCPAGSCTVTSGTPIAVTAGSTTTGIDFGLTPGGRITGTVTDATTGLPLPNAGVSLYDSSGSYAGYAYPDDMGHYGSTGLPTGTYYARTNNSLGYVNELYDDIPCVGSCTATSGTPIAVTLGVTRTGIDFALTPGGRIAGTVSDAVSGTPLGNVALQFYDAAGAYVTSGSTNGAGQYLSNAGLPAGDYYARTFNDSGFVDELYDDIPCPGGCTVTTGTPITVSSGATTSGVDFGLAQGGTVGGRVTDAATAAPLADVQVEIYDSSGSSVDYAYTDGSGQYVTTTGLPAGTYYARTYNWIGYFDELYDDILCTVSCPTTGGTPVPVTAGATTTGIDFALTRGGQIGGTVSDAGTGAPLAGVSVTVYTSSGAWAAWGSTDGSGHYAVGGLLTGTYYARTSNSLGYIEEVYDDIQCLGGCSVLTGTPIPVTVGGVTPGVDFGLTIGGRIGGRVVDAATGGAVSSVSVGIYTPSGAWMASGYTDALGNYLTSSGLPTGTYRAQTYNRVGYIDEVYDDVPCPGGCTVTSGTPIAVTVGNTTSGIDFALAAGGRFSGTVTDAATGDLVASASVRIYAASGASFGFANGDGSGHYITGTGLPAGIYYAVSTNRGGYVDELYGDVPCPGGACVPMSGAPIAVTMGATTTGIDFALDEGGLVSGTVTHAATGTPLAGVSVRIYALSGSWIGSGYADGSGQYLTSGYTDASGHYATSAGLPAGTYYAQTYNADGYVDELFDGVECAGYGCTRADGTGVSVVPGVTTGGVDFALSPGGRISGRVTESGSGTPLESVYVEIVNAEGNRVSDGYSDASGHYATRSGLPAGTYYARTANALGYVDELYDDIPCSGYGCDPTSGAPIAVTSASVTSGVDFALAAGAGLTGRVTDTVSGAPLSGVRVHVLNAAGEQLAAVSTGFDGDYRIPTGLPTGSYSLLTTNSAGYVDELHNDVACPGELRRRDRGGFAGFSVPVPSCALASGTAVSLTAGVETRVDFALARGGRASGLVTGSGAGGLGGTRVEVFGVSGEWLGAGETDVNGFYLTPAFPAGSYFLRTVNYGGWTDELYDDLPCTGCDPTAGTPVPVSAGGVSGGIHFALSLAPPSSLVGFDSVAVDEGPSGTSDATFTVTLSPPTGLAVTVDYASSDGDRHRRGGLHGSVRRLELRPARVHTDPHGADPRRHRRGAGRDVPGDAVVADQRGDRRRAGHGDDPQRRRGDGPPAHGGPHRARERRRGFVARGDRLRRGLRGAVSSGTLVTLTALRIRARWWWAGPGTCTGVGLTCDVTMDGPKTVAVEFDLAPEGGHLGAAHRDGGDRERPAPPERLWLERGGSVEPRPGLGCGLRGVHGPGDPRVRDVRSEPRGHRRGLRGHRLCAVHVPALGGAEGVREAGSTRAPSDRTPRATACG